MRPRTLVRAVLTAAAATLLTIVSAAEPAPTKKPLSQYGLDTWTTDEGLPNATVNAILRTRDGYLWLGTHDGLARFDGVRFVVFTTSNTEGLGSNGIRALSEDQQGGLWIGTNGGGLSRHFRGRFQRYTTKDGLPSDIVWAVHADPRDRSVWIGTNGAGLSQLADGRFTNVPTTDSGRVITAITRDAAGDLWVATQGEGLRRRTSAGAWTALRRADGLSSDLLTSVAADPGGGVWVGTTGGGAQRIVDGRVAELPRGLEPLRAANLAALIPQADGTLWIATNGGGIACLRDGRLETLTTAEGLHGDSVYSLHLGPDGTLWVGTNGAGLGRLRDGSFTAFTRREGLSRDFAYTTFEDHQGTLWAGTTGGLDRLQGDRWVPDGPRPGARPQAVRSITEDGDGSLWVGTYGAGVWRRQGERWATYTARDGLANDSVRALLADRAGRIWAATIGGLSVFENGSWRTFAAAGLPRESLIGLAQDRAGDLWIGSDGGGVCRFRDGACQVFTSSSGLASDVVLALLVDDDGVLWAGTNGGLSRWTGDRFVTLAAAGLPSEAVAQMVDDGRGHLWLGTSKGVSRVAKVAITTPGHAAQVRTFDRADGMKSSQCTAPGQPAGMRSRDGRAWFATTRGVVVVDPARVRMDEQPPSVAVEEVVVNGQAAVPGERVDIPPGPARIQLRYTGLSLLAPSRNTFRFRLEGFDADWVDAGSTRLAEYTGVPPGDYTFRVMAGNADGVWSAAGAALPLHVEPRLYQKTSFLAVTGLLFVGLIVAGHRLRTRSLEAGQRELAALVGARTAQLAEETERAERARAVAERLQAATRALSSTIDRDRVFDAILSALENVVPADSVSIQVLEDDDLVIIAGRGSARDALGHRFPVAAGDGRSREVLEGRDPVIRDTVPTEGESAESFHSWMGVPLHFGTRVIGMLALNKLQPKFYDAEQASLAWAFAAQAATALENARLFERQTTARAQAERLLAAARALSATMDLPSVLDVILSELQQVVPYDTVSVQVLRDGKLEIVGGRFVPDGPDLIGFMLDPADDIPNADVLRTRAPVILDDAPLRYASFRTGGLAHTPIRSWMGVPLLFGDRMVGMITLDKVEVAFYTPDQGELALSFAAQAAIAIENARLYTSVQNELQERRAAQAELARSEARFRDLFEQSLGLVFTHDLEGRLLSVNPAAAAALGYSPVDLVARNLRDLMTSPERFDDYASEFVRSRGAAGILRLRTSGGEQRQWRYRNVLRDAQGDRYVIGFAQDVSEELAVQEALRESEERFRQLAENIGAVFFMRSLDPPRMLYLSPAYEAIWGRPRGPLLQDAQVLFDTTHPDDRTLLAQALERPEHGYDVEYRILRPDGATRWIRSRAFPVADGEGRVSRIAGIAEDVTAHKHVERLREELTHTMVHDLRNPLTSIMASVELLESALAATVSETEGQVLRIARINSQKLLTLVDTILEVSRLESGAVPLEPSAWPLQALVEEQIALQQPLAMPRDLTLRNAVPPDLDDAWGDRALIGRVLQNLIGNAVKFTPRGGTITVSAEAIIDGWRVSVADDGPGIPEELQGRLFEKFVAGRQKGRGSGLGLLFCRLAVEAHGGRIGVESGPGAHFVFTLPARPRAVPGGSPAMR